MPARFPPRPASRKPAVKRDRRELNSCTNMEQFLKYVLFAIAAPFLISDWHAGFENWHQPCMTNAARMLSPNLSLLPATPKGSWIRANQNVWMVGGSAMRSRSRYRRGRSKTLSRTAQGTTLRKNGRQYASQLAIEAIATAFKCAPAEQSK